MSIFTNQIGLSINHNKIQLVEIVNKDNTFYLENVDEEYFEEAINESTKEAKFIHILQNAFNEIVLRKPLTSSKISITLPPSFFKIFEIPVDKNLTKNDLNDYIQWELTKLFPNVKSDSFSFQKIVLDSLNIKETKKAIIFAIPKELMKKIHKFCVRNSLHLKFIDNVQIAASQWFVEEIGKQDYLNIHLEDNLLSVLLHYEGNVVYQKNKSYNLISNIPEIIKEICKEIKTREIVKDEITKVFLNGNLVTKELKKSVENSTKLNVIEASPFGIFNINPNLEDKKFIKDHSAKFISTTAIALRLAR